jgi:hypothetical protein
MDPAWPADDQVRAVTNRTDCKVCAGDGHCTGAIGCIMQQDLFAPRYNGPEYKPRRDWHRLHAQTGRIFDAMRDAKWRTLTQIAELTGDPTPSISAQLRHLRKDRFGNHVVNRRHVMRGLYEYQLVINPEENDERNQH